MLIGSRADADKVIMRRRELDAYNDWIRGEALLFALLGAALALFVTSSHLRNSYELPAVRLVLDTAVAVPATAVLGLWLLARGLSGALPMLVPRDSDRQPQLLTSALALQALLSLIALVGFGLRYRAYAEDLDRWLAFAATLSLFAELHYVFTPLLSSSYISQGDFLRLFSY